MVSVIVKLQHPSTSHHPYHEFHKWGNRVCLISFLTLGMESYTTTRAEIRNSIALGMI